MSNKRIYHRAGLGSAKAMFDSLMDFFNLNGVGLGVYSYHAMNTPNSIYKEYVHSRQFYIAAVFNNYSVGERIREYYELDVLTKYIVRYKNIWRPNVKLY